ncbi:hypothetical protein HMI54_001189 [Coelomomyces lativittatus]|nr:hypothetical protein HMI54_001189 [Coelomomyces lativittatus]
MFPRSGNDPLALTSFSTTTPPPPSDTLPLVSFDDFGKLRLLPAQHFETSEKLKDECKDFKEQLSEFTSLVQDLMRHVDSKVKQVENEKLKVCT